MLCRFFSFRPRLARSNLQYSQILEQCQEISQLSILDIRERYGKEMYLKNFFSNISKRARVMQTYQILEITHLLIQQAELRTPEYVGNLWFDLVKEMFTRRENLGPQEIITFCHTYCFVQSGNPMIGRMFEEMSKQFEDFDFSEIRSLPLPELEKALWTFSYKHKGSQTMYKDLSIAFLKHRDLETLSFRQLAKLSSLFGRTPNGRVGGIDFFKYMEKKIWEAAHSRSIDTIEEMVDIAYYLMPKNIGSNKFRVLLEVYLYNMLTSASTIISTAKLVRLLNGYSNLRFSYGPLNEVLKQLVQQSKTLFSLSDLTHILWAFSRYKESSDLFLNSLLAQYKSLLEDDPELSFRDFSFLVTGMMNASIDSDEIWELFNNLCLKLVQRSYIKDHYLIKLLAVFAEKTNYHELYRQIMNQLMNPERLPSFNTMDLTRLLIITSENYLLQRPDFIGALEDKVFEHINSLSVDEMAEAAYAFTRMNCCSLELIELLEKRILENNLEKASPRALGIACYAFAEHNRPVFLDRAMMYAMGALFEAQNKYFQELSSDDEGDLVVHNEDFVNLSAVVPAATLIQICWMACVTGLEDTQFWTDKLVQSLFNIGYTSKPYTMNRWVFHSRVEQQDESLVKDADDFHHTLLLQTLGMITEKNEFREILQSRGFLKNKNIDRVHPGYSHHVSRALRRKGAISKDLDVDLGFTKKLQVDQTVVMLYDENDFPQKTSQKNSDALKTSRRLEKHLYESLDYNVVEVFYQDWKKDPEAVLDLIIK